MVKKPRRSMDWFLYAKDLRHERVKEGRNLFFEVSRVQFYYLIVKENIA